nr:uncharacterized protein LOC105102808 isoform X2 [Camelus dromedarius]
MPCWAGEGGWLPRVGPGPSRRFLGFPGPSLASPLLGKGESHALGLAWGEVNRKTRVLQSLGLGWGRLSWGLGEQSTSRRQVPCVGPRRGGKAAPRSRRTSGLKTPVGGITNGGSGHSSLPLPFPHVFLTQTLFKSVSSHISSTPGAARAESGLCPPGNPSCGGANTVGCLDAVRSTTRSVHLHPLRRWTVREVVGAELSRGALKTCLLCHLCRRSVRSHPLTLSGAESPAPAAGGARQAPVSSLQEEAPSAQKTPRLAIFQALTCCQGHRSNAGSTWHQQASGPLDEGQGRPACHDLCYQLLAYI